MKRIPEEVWEELRSLQNLSIKNRDDLQNVTVEELLEYLKDVQMHIEQYGGKPKTPDYTVLLDLIVLLDMIKRCVFPDEFIRHFEVSTYPWLLAVTTTSIIGAYRPSNLSQYQRMDT